MKDDRVLELNNETKKQRTVQDIILDHSYVLMKALYDYCCDVKPWIHNINDRTMLELLNIDKSEYSIHTARYMKGNISFNITKIEQLKNNGSRFHYLFSLLDHDTTTIISNVSDIDYKNSDKKYIMGQLYDAAMNGKVDSRFVAACKLILGGNYEVK